uniref:Uncharacterized protein n=1 Tax=viral metagenome TaxID=1070528 RepID=A0A6C0KJF7_9ZZZZ
MIPYDCLYIIRSIFIAAIFRNKTMVSKKSCYTT